MNGYLQTVANTLALLALLAFLISSCVTISIWWGGPTHRTEVALGVVSAVLAVLEIERNKVFFGSWYEALATHWRFVVAAALVSVSVALFWIFLPWRASLYHRCGVEAYRGLETLKAAEQFRWALALDPDRNDSRYSLARILEETGDVTGAETAYLQILSSGSEEMPEAAIELALLKLKRSDAGDHRVIQNAEDALHLLRIADHQLAQRPTEGNASKDQLYHSLRRNRAWAYLRLGDSLRAHDELGKARKLGELTPIADCLHAMRKEAAEELDLEWRRAWQGCSGASWKDGVPERWRAAADACLEEKEGKPARCWTGTP